MGDGNHVYLTSVIWIIMLQKSYSKFLCQIQVLGRPLYDSHVITTTQKKLHPHT